MTLVEEIREKLRRYSREDLKYNEPHFTQQMHLRQGTREEVEYHLLHPDKLVHVSEELGKYGDIKYELYFTISNVRTLKIPVLFNPTGQEMFIYPNLYHAA